MAKCEDKILISVIITAYDRRQYLLNAIKSALVQSLPRKLYEIIVVKNFHDNEIDRFIQDNKIKEVYSEQKNQGRMVIDAFEKAEGEIISFLDDDDVFFPEKLKFVVEIFTLNSTIVYFHNGYKASREFDKPFYVSVSKESQELKQGKKSRVKIVDRNSSKRNISIFKQDGGDFNSSCISVKKKLITDNMAFLKNIKHSVDTGLFFCALKSSGDLLMDHILLNGYRLSNVNSSTYTVKSLISEKKKRSVNSCEENKLDEDKVYNYFCQLLGDLLEIKSILLERDNNLKYLLDYQIASVSISKNMRLLLKGDTAARKSLLMNALAYTKASFSPYYITKRVIKNWILDLKGFISVSIFYICRLIKFERAI